MCTQLGSNYSRVTVQDPSLAEHLAGATNDISDDVAASLTAFATEEATEYR